MEDSTALLPTPVLIERYRLNDESAFEQLVSRYHCLVFGVCMRLLRHRQDAEDVTQETFSRVARYLGKWDVDRPIEPWLATIAGNRCRTFLSRQRLHHTLPLPAEPAADSTRQRAAEESLREEVGLALRQLPTNHRVAFTLFHEQSMGYAEIAESMQCPVGTAKTWVHRARAALMGQLLKREVVTANPSQEERIRKNHRNHRKSNRSLRMGKHEL
ncbi:ECF RNA polymerase sigma factor SigW [Planctomycetes bacterium CA13]|uniref:ECF RNA polymerase sigma factor SigW n=1 Tax=Novipirellula herctigrandis TaxID=2527986 RepID=A0A5C5Z996_9BACT|nr:ECF RNA polymerase sigma factor SigW [Planctomycetes bacterium CA13]